MKDLHVDTPSIYLSQITVNSVVGGHPQELEKCLLIDLHCSLLEMV